MARRVVLLGGMVGDKADVEDGGLDGYGRIEDEGEGE